MPHARLGPSNPRWRACPGSVREEAVYQNISGAAAIDGTGSHLLLEMCLENGVDAMAYDMQIIGANHHDMPMGWMVEPGRGYPAGATFGDHVATIAYPAHRTERVDALSRDRAVGPDQ